MLEGNAGIVGVPRDSWVPIPGRGRSKINAALALGGPDLMMETFRDLTGLDFDGYLLTGFAGFEGLIEVLGGLEIEVPRPFKDSAAKADIEAGLQVLHAVLGAYIAGATGEQVSLPLPAELAYVSHEGGEFADGVWTLAGEVAAGGTLTATLEATVGEDAAGEIVAVATITAGAETYTGSARLAIGTQMYFPLVAQEWAAP